MKTEKGAAATGKPKEPSRNTGQKQTRDAPAKPGTTTKARPTTK